MGEQRKSRGTVVYVAGASQEIERAEAMIATLRELGMGVQISVDWPKRFREERARYAAESDTAVPVEVMREIYDEELEGARSCDVFVLLHPPKANDTVVAWCELAAARLGAEGRRPVVIVSGWDGVSPLDRVEADLHPLATVFATMIVGTDDDVATWLGGFMTARRAA